MSHRAIVLGLWLAAAPLPLGRTAAAELPAERPPIRFAIAPQSLVSALETYSRVSGVHLLYDSRLADGRRSPGAAGVLDAEAALRSLLVGTDLIAHYTGADDVVLEPAWTTDAAPPPTGAPVLALETLRVHGPGAALGAPAAGNDYRRYGGVIQAAIQSALRQDAGTRSGAYRIEVRLWVDRAGAVRNSELVGSTGDRERDAAVARVIGGIATAAPPPDMPQPISVRVAVRPQ
jgi:TonB family protein